MIAPVASDETSARPEEHAPEARRIDLDIGLDIDIDIVAGVELHDAPERDLLDSASDSWRYLRFCDMLDEIGRPPDEGAAHLSLMNQA